MGFPFLVHAFAFCRVALVAGEPAAGDLAADCADALRQRRWRGDALLADHLDALVGRGPTAMLRQLAVSLDELSEVLEGDPLVGGGRIDRQTVARRCRLPAGRHPLTHAR